MSVPKRSTLSLDLNLTRSLLIFEILKLEVALNESYDHRAEAFVIDGAFYIGQLGEELTRTVALEYPSNNGNVDIILGYSLAFDEAELAKRLGTPIEVSSVDSAAFEALAPTLGPESLLYSVTFSYAQYYSAAQFIYKWLFPAVSEPA